MYTILLIFMHAIRMHIMITLDKGSHVSSNLVASAVRRDTPYFRQAATRPPLSIAVL